MFEQSILTGAPKKRRAWTISISLMGQILAIGVAVLIPLVAYDQLPLGKLAPKPGLPTPPGGKGNKPPSHVKVTEVRWQIRSGKLVYPRSIPARPQMIVDPAQPLDTETGGIGVVGGVEWPGDGRDTVVGSILSAASRQVRPGPPPEVKPNAATPKKQDIPRIRLGGHVLEARLIHRVMPAYPAPARMVRAAGKVELRAVIGRDGRIQEITVLSGHPFLIQAAIDAVRQWVYQPTMLNGEPVEVDTVITVNFTLAR